MHKKAKENKLSANLYTPMCLLYRPEFLLLSSGTGSESKFWAFPHRGWWTNSINFNPLGNSSKIIGKC